MTKYNHKWSREDGTKSNRCLKCGRLKKQLTRKKFKWHFSACGRTVARTKKIYIGCTMSDQDYAVKEIIE